MRLRRNKVRRRLPEENKKQQFFSGPNSEEKTPFFSGHEAIQRKLNIGKASDPQEKEAEDTARQVANQPVQKAEDKKEEPVQKADKKEEEKTAQKAEKKEDEKAVQKAEEKKEEPVQKAEKKEDEKAVQKAEEKKEEPVQKAEKKEDEKAVQAKADPSVQAASGKEKKEQGDGSAHATLEDMLAKQKGRGFALPDDLRMEMETKLHSHFAQVRIHTDNEAEQMCEEIHALAFTHGNDIYFNKGQYDPNSSSGKELLAHELTHVVQQKG